MVEVDKKEHIELKTDIALPADVNIGEKESENTEK